MPVSCVFIPGIPVHFGDPPQQVHEVEGGQERLPEVPAAQGHDQGNTVIKCLKHKIENTM